MSKPKHVTLALASDAEAIRRISVVLDPYIQNLHPKHEAGTKGVIEDIKAMLIAEFQGFGFEYIDIHDDPAGAGHNKENGNAGNDN